MSPAVLSPTRVIPDPSQRIAIEHVDGPLLVIAGAGTGKTTVLTQRIAHLIRQGHAQVNEVLALTYTENAAEEMKKRVRGELEGRNLDGLQVCTFHAWCNGLLHRRGAGFGILDDKDLWVYLRRRIRDLQLKHFVRAANVSQFLDDLLDFMRRCQDELVSPEQYAGYVDRVERGEASAQRVARSKKQGELNESEILTRCREIATVYAFVEQTLAEKNLGTFGHMITRAYWLLKDDVDVLDEERARIKFILVDEFQDANFAQLEVLALLAKGHGNVFAVGDPDQAIYRFRGASSAAFTLFRRHFPQAGLLVLDKNRRSFNPILRCAFGIVNENPPVFADAAESPGYRRMPLASQREIEAVQRGETVNAPAVEIITWADKEVEAFELADRIRRRRKEQRCAWSDFAVLYRQHGHREELVKELMQRSIPFSIEGLDVLRTPEVRDLLACLTAAVSPSDAAALFRVAALPQFAIDPRELRTAMRSARRDELDLRKTLQNLAGGSAVLSAVDEVHGEVKKEGVLAGEAVRRVACHFSLRSGPAVTTFQKFVENWQTRPIAEVGSAGEFLDYLEYFVQAKSASIPLPPATEDAVRLMTAHSAKGLEFRHVAIIRGSSTTFPCGWREPLVDLPRELRRTTSSETDKVVNEQEERRLLYVAMTRAKDTLSIYAKQGTGTDPRPTKFLREFMSNASYRSFWRTRPAVPLQDDLFAEEGQIVLEHSNVASWLLMPPSENFVTSLSASAIDIYEKCPLRFKLEREWNLPREVPAALHYGKIMHDVLRTFYDGKKLGRELKAEDLIAIFEEGMAGAGIADRYQYDLYLRQGREQITLFWQLSRTTPEPQVIETEHNFELRVGTTKVRGRIDRIDRASDGRLAIIDYKTGKPKSQEDADESLQLSLYALAMRELRGQPASQLIFYNLENNSAISTTRLDPELDAIEMRVQEVADKISAGVFPPIPGYQCTFCPYRNLCPETEKMVAVLSNPPRRN